MGGEGGSGCVNNVWVVEGGSGCVMHGWRRVGMVVLTMFPYRSRPYQLMLSGFSMK